MLIQIQTNVGKKTKTMWIRTAQWQPREILNKQGEPADQTALTYRSKGLYIYGKSDWKNASKVKTMLKQSRDSSCIVPVKKHQRPIK